MSVVAEHWHLRMLVPPKGEFSMLPLNAEARKIANAWDPAKESPSEQCKSYGAAAIMRVPGRLYIHWTDDNTLQMDVDSGTQTRVFHFGGGETPTPQPSQWQGYSVAEWEGVPAQELRARKAGAPPDPRAGLRVTTTRMRAGYLRKNGVPYSENARLVEYFDRFTEPNGDDWIVVDSIVTDPQYLTQPYLTSSAFRKIPDRSGWIRHPAAPIRQGKLRRTTTTSRRTLSAPAPSPAGTQSVKLRAELPPLRQTRAVQAARKEPA